MRESVQLQLRKCEKRFMFNACRVSMEADLDVREEGARDGQIEATCVRKFLTEDFCRCPPLLFLGLSNLYEYVTQDLII